MRHLSIICDYFGITRNANVKSRSVRNNKIASVMREKKEKRHHLAWIQPSEKMPDVCRDVFFPFINPRRMHPRVISGYVKPSYPPDIIRITLFMLFFIRTLFRRGRCRWRWLQGERKRDGMGRRRSWKTKRNHDGAFADLTKQFKRLSCPFNALKRLAEGGRIAITETPCLEWKIIQA